MNKIFILFLKNANTGYSSLLIADFSMNIWMKTYKGNMYKIFRNQKKWKTKQTEK